MSDWVCCLNSEEVPSIKRAFLPHVMGHTPTQFGTLLRNGAHCHVLWLCGNSAATLRLSLLHSSAVLLASLRPVWPKCTNLLPAQCQTSPLFCLSSEAPPCAHVLNWLGGQRLDRLRTLHRMHPWCSNSPGTHRSTRNSTARLASLLLNSAALLASQACGSSRLSTLRQLCGKSFGNSTATPAKPLQQLTQPLTQLTQP